MKSKIKLITLIIVLCFPILHPSLAVGQDLVPDLKGKWHGSAFLSADAKGFNSSNRTITLVVKNQSGLDFSGNIETRNKGIIRQFEFAGFLDKHKRYICLVTQGVDINIGYLITKNIMKVHLRSFGNNSEVAIYRLTKEKLSAN